MARKRAEDLRPVWKGPEPLRHDGRICFGIDYFATEKDADEYALFVRARGDSYNGGWFHGMACGRAPEFDRKDESGKSIEFAVTVR